MTMTYMTAASAGTSLISSNPKGSAAQQADSAKLDIKPATALKDAPVDDTGPLKANVEISTRAQKIQKLNEEFFAAGPQAFKVSAAFIDRLEEYGLISANEAKDLGGRAGAINSEGGGAKTVAQLSTFIDGFTDSLNNVAPDNPLIEVLQQAQTVIDNFNNPTTTSLAVNIPNITEQLKHYNQTTDRLPMADQAAFDQLVLALNIANTLTPGTNNTAEIDRYLAVSRL